jgi:ribose 5-phosphate isomerase B
MKFVVGSDHAGIGLRTHLVETLEAGGHEVLATHGPASAEQSCDYPDIAEQVCADMAGRADVFGLIVCGTGQGVGMVANRMPGIRAAVCSDVFSAKMARAHNDANVLCMGQRVVGPGLAAEILATFCATSFEGGRHQRRVDKIARLD